MCDKPTLFNKWSDGYRPTEARARSTDPQTSHDAAASVNTKRGQKIVLAWLRNYGPATHGQLADGVAGFGLEPSSARGRCRELVNAGLVRDTGRKAKTRTGRLSIIWEVTDRPSAQPTTEHNPPTKGEDMKTYPTKDLKDGEYDFEIVSAEEKLSKNNNPMIEVQLKVFIDDGVVEYVRDWLVESFAFKVRRFCQTTGLMEQYEAGDLRDSDCIGACGVAKLRLEEDDDFGEQLRVNTYVKPPEVPEPPKAKPQRRTAPEAATVPLDETKDIPF